MLNVFHYAEDSLNLSADKLVKKDILANGNKGLSTEKILDVAREQVRRFGESKTNIVDIARALGTSHTTIYRYFKSKSEVFDALVEAAMEDERVLASEYCNTGTAAGERLKGLVLALHSRKKERFANDREVYLLYKRVVEERPEIVLAYAENMTRLVESILNDGVSQGEFDIPDTREAACVVRDAVTVFIHPAHVAMAATAGINQIAGLTNLLNTLLKAFEHR